MKQRGSIKHLNPSRTSCHGQVLVHPALAVPRDLPGHQVAAPAVLRLLRHVWRRLRRATTKHASAVHVYLCDCRYIWDTQAVKICIDCYNSSHGEPALDRVTVVVNACVMPRVNRKGNWETGTVRYEQEGRGLRRTSFGILAPCSSASRNRGPRSVLCVLLCGSASRRQCQRSNRK